MYLDMPMWFTIASIHPYNQAYAVLSEYDIARILMLR